MLSQPPVSGSSPGPTLRRWWRSGCWPGLSEFRPSPENGRRKSTERSEAQSGRSETELSDKKVRNNVFGQQTRTSLLNKKWTNLEKLRSELFRTSQISKKKHFLTNLFYTNLFEWHYWYYFFKRTTISTRRGHFFKKERSAVKTFFVIVTVSKFLL